MLEIILAVVAGLVLVGLVDQLPGGYWRYRNRAPGNVRASAYIKARRRGR